MSSFGKRPRRKEETNWNKKGQLSIFVIIALVIVGLVALFFVFRGTLFAENIPAELKPVFDFYQQCIEQEARAAIDIAETQGGWVYPEPYISGSAYAPFSSQLNFLGSPVPYWYYISANGVIKENVPTKTEIEDGISKYIEEKVNVNCNFESFYQKAFLIDMSAPSVKTKIDKLKVTIDFDSDFKVSKGENSARKTNYNFVIDSQLGKLYNNALLIYNKEKKEAFLENYSVDVLREYTPVDGVEISCSGKVWKSRQVVDDLKNALEANIGALKFKGDYYTLNRAEEKYFVIDLPMDNSVNLIYSKNWPTKVEIQGADNELMIASPVGTQSGMGIMGFCYAPYHFVYDLSFPVLVQLFGGNELFQFPVVVVVDKNLPREGIASEISTEAGAMDICQYKTQDLEVNVYDVNMHKVNANLSYSCITSRCELGGTEDGTFIGKAPACVNGYLRVNAFGYMEKKQIVSTNEESVVDVILDREYDISIELEVGGKSFDGNAIISFMGERVTSTLLPDASKIKLSEGLYNVSVMAYSNSSITITSTTRTQCVTVTKGGIAGFFGATEEKCFDVKMPETKIESALIGGGQSEIYFLPSDLEDGKIKLRVDSLPKPNSLDDLSKNFEEFQDKGVILET